MDTVAKDVAWMMGSTALVLLPTPAASSPTGG